MSFLVSGGTYWMPDRDIRLPPEHDRTLHPQRVVVAVVGREWMADEAWPFSLIVPCSTEPRRSTRLCVPLKRGDGNLTKDTWARVSAVQPVLKDQLRGYSQLGQLKPSSLDLIRENLAVYLGMLD